jgi:hypothetical protein
MNIDNLVRTAVDKIKSNWGLPDKGFIAGGSIANLVWELVSGNKAVVNDIDVFIFDGAIDKIDTDDKTLLFRYQEKETKFWEDYTGMRFSSINKDFYTIVSSEHDGMFNKIKYKSNKVDTDLILRSFDINCTKVGYSIEEDKVYYDKDFEEFLQTGELKISNLMTPSHSAIRIVKKKKELNCKLEKFELDLLRHSLEWRFTDIIKIRFRERYFEMFKEYSEDLKEYFNIRRDQNSEQYVKINFGEDVNLYYLESIINSEVDNPFFGKQVFDDENIRQIYNSFEFIFYMRNIYNNKNLPEMWKKLYFFFNDVSYIDCKPTTEDLELISRLGFYAPDSIENLKGMKLSEQIKLFKSVLEKYEYDPIIAISILEKHKLSEIELNEQNLLLLELSVRKKIVNDTRGKANKILGIKEDLPINNPEWWR